MSRRHDKRAMGRKERDLQRIYKMLFGRHDWSTPYAFHALRGGAPHVWMSNFRTRKSVLMGDDPLSHLLRNGRKKPFIAKKKRSQ